MLVRNFESFLDLKGVEWIEWQMKLAARSTNNPGPGFSAKEREIFFFSLFPALKVSDLRSRVVAVAVALLVLVVVVVEVEVEVRGNKRFRNNYSGCASLDSGLRFLYWVNMASFLQVLSRQSIKR